jgi:hypothetical protein
MEEFADSANWTYSPLWLILQTAYRAPANDYAGGPPVTPTVIRFSTFQDACAQNMQRDQREARIM